MVVSQHIGRLPRWAHPGTRRISRKHHWSNALIISDKINFLDRLTEYPPCHLAVETVMPFSLQGSFKVPLLRHPTQGYIDTEQPSTWWWWDSKQVKHCCQHLPVPFTYIVLIILMIMLYPYIRMSFINLVLVVVFLPIMFVFILCVFCSIVMFWLLLLMFMHIRLICALIKITDWLTYLLTFSFFG